MIDCPPYSTPTVDLARHDAAHDAECLASMRKTAAASLPPGLRMRGGWR